MSSSRPGWENADRCAGMRAWVHDHASSDWHAALDEALQIPLPWYRVQSLAAVAAAAPEDRVDDLLNRAIREAARDTDAYRRTAVLHWVIDAAVDRGRLAPARQYLRDALNACPEVTPLKSRAETLEHLLTPAVRLGIDDTRLVANALLDVATALMTDQFQILRKWGKTYVKRLLSTAWPDYPDLVQELLAARFGPARATELIVRRSRAMRTGEAPG